MAKHDSYDLMLKIFNLDIPDTDYRKDNHFDLRQRDEPIIHSLCFNENSVLDHYRFMVIPHREDEIETEEYRGWESIYKVRDLDNDNSYLVLVTDKYYPERKEIVCDYRFTNGPAVVKTLEATEERIDKYNF